MLSTLSVPYPRSQLLTGALHWWLLVVCDSGLWLLLSCGFTVFAKAGNFQGCDVCYLRLVQGARAMLAMCDSSWVRPVSGTHSSQLIGWSSVSWSCLTTKEQMSEIWLGVARKKGPNGFVSLPQCGPQHLNNFEPQLTWQHEGILGEEVGHAGTIAAEGPGSSGCLILWKEVWRRV